MFKVFIDPGHGWNEYGAVNRYGIKEKTINLTVCLKLKELLLANNFDVMMSRETDTGVSLSQRCNMANEWKADLFISVHHNAGGGDGYEVIHSIVGGKGKEFAHIVGEEFKKTGQNERSVYYRESENFKGKDYYAVISDTSMPAVITEYAFMDTKDFETIDTLNEQYMEAQAIYTAICRLFYSNSCSDKKHWAYDSWRNLKNKGIIINEQRFDDKITRAEVFVLLNQIFQKCNEN